MPADKKKSKQTKTSAFDFPDEKESAVPEEAPVSRKRSVPPTTRYSDDSDSEDGKADCLSEANPEMEMSSLLNSFGADINKTLLAKRKRLATFTSASLKTSNRKYEEIFAHQQNERNKMSEEFSKQIHSVFTQWENDIQKSKDNEEKLEAMIKQLQKTLQQQRVVQNQRLKSLKTLHEQYFKGTADLGRVHQEQQLNINSELRKELMQLQKKMMDDARQEEISNVRKSLQTMLAQV